MAERKFIKRKKSMEVRALVKELDIPFRLAQIAWDRNIRTKDELKKYLYGRREDMYDPSLIRNIDKVYEKIITAIKDKSRIWIFGDYDCDGVTSTATMVLGLRRLGAKVGYRLPDRLSEGYGMSSKAVKELYDKGCDLIITVDNGIRQFKEIEYAKKLGMDVIVLDHHEPGDRLPEPDILIDLHIKGETYPYKHLAGCGLAWKVIQYIYKRLGREKEAYDFIDIVAIGTVADVVPLTDENRLIVKEGLKMLNNYGYNRNGINILKELFNIEPSHMYAQDIGFKIAPAINAPGRLKERGAELSLSLLLEDRPVEDVAKEMFEINEYRKELTAVSTAKAEEIVKDMMKDKIFVVFVPDVPEGVVGLVSGKLTEKYHRPSLVFSQGHDCFKASARSIPEFNLIESLNAVSDCFLKYGGHAQAAGMSVEESMDKIDELRKRINEYADGKLTNEDLVSKVYIDGEIGIDNINNEFLDILEQVEPCGQDNEKPVFTFNNFLAKEKNVAGYGWRHYTLMGKDEEHVRVFGPDNIEMVGFGLANCYQDMNCPTCMNITGVPSINWFRGHSRFSIEAFDFQDTFQKTNAVRTRENILRRMQNAAIKI